MGEKSPGSPATADGLGPPGNLNDVRMRDSTERTAAADAAAKEEAIKLAAEAAAREEEMRQEGLRREMEARRQAEERARAERERAQEWVLVSLMTIGTLQEAQQLIVEVGLVSPDRLSRLAWMEARAVGPGRVSQRSWFFNVRKSDDVVAAMAAAARHAYVRTKDGKMWKLCPAMRGGSSRTGAAPTWSRPTTTAWAPDQESYVWGPNGIHCTTGTPRRTYAEATGGEKESVDVAGVLKAFQQEFRAEVKKDMQEAIAKALAAQAAESPAASAAPRGGRASAQDPEAQLKQLQQKVTELEVAKAKVQQQYFESFAGKVAAEFKVQQLEGTVTELTDRIKALESPFHTPVRPSSAAAPQGDAPQPAAMPVPEGEMFSKGVSGGRRAGGQEARRMWTPPGGQGTNLEYPPSVAGAPFIFNSALPVGGVVPVHPKEAGPESPGKEEAKEQEVRKEEEGGQPAVAAAPAAAAAPAGAAVCPQGREGTGSKVRLPDRQPGESGVTPDAKVTRSAEPAGAASSEEEAGGLAPMRLNSNFSAAAGQAEMSDQNR